MACSGGGRGRRRSVSEEFFNMSVADVAGGDRPGAVTGSEQELPEGGMACEEPDAERQLIRD